MAQISIDFKRWYPFMLVRIYTQRTSNIEHIYKAKIDLPDSILYNNAPDGFTFVISALLRFGLRPFGLVRLVSAPNLR